eukprot:GEMP01071099.1.p1 GENE.GEMP01071099.1~~GEMP01071099.1.p1  ORF type:complete len:210 (+),score=45.55 GEMP01071099.1:132-761(+)
MDRVFDLEKLLQISRDERQRLKGELSIATRALTHHADVLQEIGDLRTEKAQLEQALSRSITELDDIGRAVAELPLLGRASWSLNNIAGDASILAPAGCVKRAAASNGFLPPNSTDGDHHVAPGKLAARHRGVEEEDLLHQGTPDIEVRRNLHRLASPTVDHRNAEAVENKATHIGMILYDANMKSRACQETCQRTAVWLLIQLVNSYEA